MVKFNSMYVNGGEFTQADMDFLKSKKISYLYYQMSSLKNDNIIYQADWLTDAQIRGVTDIAHANGFKILSWVGCSNVMAEGPDLYAQEKRDAVIAQEVAQVQKFNFDGMAMDLEGTGFGNAPSNIEGMAALTEWTEQETNAMHSLGKESHPFIFGGAGLWVGNMPLWIEGVVSKFKADCPVLTLDAALSEYNSVVTDEWGTSERVGYVEALKAWTDYCPSPFSLYLSKWEGFLERMSWVDDFINLYGLSNKLLGFTLYDYIGSAWFAPLNPPESQIGNVDSPYTADEWQAWDSWTPKNIDVPPPPPDLTIPLVILASTAIGLGVSRVI